MISLRSLFVSTLALSSSFLFSAPTAVQAADWAVIVAGSSGYDNYRHQADACHAYQVVHSGGIDDDHIITMLADDVANDPSNPFPGQLFNRPTAAGVKGTDVYKGCKKDYTGASVVPATFLSVITGDATGLPKGSKVLNSTEEDRVFITFIDHGATGLIAFPDGSYLYAADLNNALQTMHKKKMYKQLVFYLEACESGSMFESILPTNMSIYATTAANADESSYGTYCAGETPGDSVNGVELNTCLGDLYSVNWMEDADAVGMKQSIKDQMAVVVNKTAQSHVCEFGDLTFKEEPIGDFEGSGIAEGLDNNNHIKLGGMTLGGSNAAHTKPHNHVDSRDIAFHNAYHSYKRSSPQSKQRKAALLKLQQEVALRLEAEEVFEALAHEFTASVNGVLSAEALFGAANLPVVCDACCKTVDAAIKQHCGGFNDYSLQYHRVVVNACDAAKQSHEAAQMMVQTVKAVCAKPATLIQM